MTSKDHTIARLLKELQELRKVKTVNVANAIPDASAEARAYVRELTTKLDAAEKQIADLRVVCRPDSLKQWNALAAEVAKANTDRDAWKQIAVGTIGHVHTAVAKARAEARDATMRLVDMRTTVKIWETEVRRVARGPRIKELLRNGWGDNELGNLTDKNGNHRPGCICPMCLPVR
jgi:hypothetical protein